MTARELRTVGLCKEYPGTRALDDVSVRFDGGRVHALIGKNGAGKSTLVKILSGATHPTAGRIAIDGREVALRNPQDAFDKGIATVYQELSLVPGLTVAENILFPIRQHHKKHPWRQADDLVKAKLAMVGLDGFQNYYPANLSGGQRKRVALARAIALNPEVILYDEPTTGLDPIRSDIISELILKLARELGVTTVVVTHDMKSAYKVADRIIMLHNGKVIADGNADYVRHHPHPVVQQFINGQVSEDDLAVLRMTGAAGSAQYLPRDFEQ